MTGEHRSGPFLPAGPYRIAAGYARKALLQGWMLRGFGLLFAAAIAWVLANRVPALLRDASIWNAADAIEVPAEFEGTVSSGLGVMPKHQGNVRFVALDGTKHEGRIEFETLTEIDRDVASVVRYRPNEPEAWVYCWAGQNLVNRWLLLAVIAGMFGGLLVPLFWLLGGRWLRQCRLSAAIAEHGREAVAKLLSVQEQRQYGRIVNRIVRVELATSDGPTKFAEVFARKQGLPCQVADQLVLVVVSPRFPRQCIVLRQDLWPLELPAGQDQQALQRIEAAFPSRVEPKDR